jgi:ribosomal protein S21
MGLTAAERKITGKHMRKKTHYEGRNEKNKKKKDAEKYSNNAIRKNYLTENIEYY